MISPSPKSDELLQLMTSYRLKPTITTTTRPTSHTLIDQIWVPWDLTSRNCGTLQFGTSDHYPLLWDAPITTSSPPPSLTEKKFTRRITDKNIVKFEELLMNTDWTSLEACRNPDHAIDILISTINSAYFQACPLSTHIDNRSNTHSPPWLTDTIKAEIKRKHFILRRCKTYPSLLPDYKL